ncbi:hypothetical protein J3486_06475 [Streptomyces sp. VRA16 Mangrove soil]|nr:hypothetical protein [Streptomyces sp. VRA16 Mangrove soil]
MGVGTSRTGEARRDRIPGYESGPLAHRSELLDEPLFWLGHLTPCVLVNEEAQELLWGADLDAAEAFHRELTGQARWPVFTVPVRGGRLHVVYRNLTDDRGIDHLLHPGAADRAELLASDDGHFMGPALSWSELTAAADNRLPGGSTTDADARLLLLLPAFGDADVPDDAADRVAAALDALTAVEDPQRLATLITEHQGPCGAPQWTTGPDGVRRNDGPYSYRNPANRFALPPDRLALVSAALAP